VIAIAMLSVALGGPLLAQQVDPDEGTLSSIRPRIPEPMVFDLVRPLGAERGEIEVNSLFRSTPTGPAPHLLWAPEVEWTFADGHGVEVELPMEDTRRDSLKVGVQGTFPGPAPRAFIHGWQGIWEGAARDGAQVDVLYLAGVRPHPRWSGFTMNGIRYDRTSRRTVFLGNYSIFVHSGRLMNYGVEVNLWREQDARRVMVMPQVHVRKNRINVQAGAGGVRSSGRHLLQLALRVSREF
jgi:hypothetical protein